MTLKVSSCIVLEFLHMESRASTIGIFMIFVVSADEVGRNRLVTASLCPIWTHTEAIFDIIGVLDTVQVTADLFTVLNRMQCPYDNRINYVTI